ncbi:MAG: lysophospholipid acyltransferase family protein [Microcoleaceae cyanobacterium]
MLTLAYPLGAGVVLPTYFSRIDVFGQANIPDSGPVILAPTHRSRWDGLMIPYVAGRYATGRDLRYMVTIDEMQGFQGWLIRQMGGFAINQQHPTVATFRKAVEILYNREMMVVFPEGDIFRDRQIHPLKPGLARLALQAESIDQNLNVQVVPVAINYEPGIPCLGAQVQVRIGQPLKASDYCPRAMDQDSASRKQFKQAARTLTADLSDSLFDLNRQSAFA